MSKDAKEKMKLDQEYDESNKLDDIEIFYLNHYMHRVMHMAINNLIEKVEQHYRKEKEELRQSYEQKGQVTMKEHIDKMMDHKVQVATLKA